VGVTFETPDGDLKKRGEVEIEQQDLEKVREMTGKRTMELEFSGDGHLIRVTEVDLN
jgi:hypothetical protein